MNTTAAVSVTNMTFGDVLNEELQGLSWEFVETEKNQYLEVNGADVMVFDVNASPTQQQGSSFWIRNKHKNGAIHEPATVAAFFAMKRIFKRRINTIFDIGALYGYFSVMSGSLFPHAEITGFEMNSVSFEAFKKNARINKEMFGRCIHCANVGLSDISSLSLPVVIEGFVLSEGGKSSNEVAGKSDVIDVYTLDNYTKLVGNEPDLIKLDVEGYQTKIIPGALATIREHKPAVIMEFDALARMQAMQGNNKEIADYFFQMGYRCWWIGDQRNGKGCFEEIVSEDIDVSKEINSLAVFVHKDWLENIV